MDTLFPYTTLFRSLHGGLWRRHHPRRLHRCDPPGRPGRRALPCACPGRVGPGDAGVPAAAAPGPPGADVRRAGTEFLRRVRRPQIRRATGRESVCLYVLILVVAVSLKKKTTKN